MPIADKPKEMLKSPEVTKMTMEDAHKELLGLLKDKFWELMDIHSDATYLNSDADDYKKKLDEFHRLQSRIFALLYLWHELTQEG